MRSEKNGQKLPEMLPYFNYNAYGLLYMKLMLQSKMIISNFGQNRSTAVSVHAIRTNKRSQVHNHKRMHLKRQIEWWCQIFDWNLENSCFGICRKYSQNVMKCCHVAKIQCFYMKLMLVRK